MKTDHPLHLYQQVLLLALDGKRGTPVLPYANLAVAGAIVADWLLAGRISVDDSRRFLVTVEDTRASGDPVFDECLRLAATDRKLPLRRLIGRVARAPRLYHKAADTLCARGVLRSDRELVLGLFPRQVYRELDPMPKKLLVERVRAVIFSATARSDASLAMLIALAHGANLLWRIFGRQEIRRRKARIDEIVSGNTGPDAMLRLSKTLRQAVAVSIAVNSGVIG